MNKTVIRRMVPDDAVMAAYIEKECFTDPWSEKVYRQTLELPYARYYAAECDGKIIAACGMQLIGGDGEISNVAVLPQYRRSGIAHELLQRAIDDGMLEGSGDFTLEVRESNTAAIALYKSFGFVTEGVRKNFYTDPCENALIMWKRKQNA